MPEPSRQQRLGTKIEEYVRTVRLWTRRMNFSLHRLALAAGLSPGTLRNMFDEDWNPRLETLVALERFIRRYTEDLQHRAKI